MLYKEPFVLYLNITAIVILLLMILPTLLNKKEKLVVRISFSMIFIIVIINCICNLIIFYFQIHQLLFLQFSLMVFPYLFGPSMYFYVIFTNYDGKIKNFFAHFILPILVMVFGIYFLKNNTSENKAILQKILTSQYLPYTLINTCALIVSIYYLFISKKAVKKVALDENSGLYIQKKLKRDWTNEFVNYMTFSVTSFLLIDIIGVAFFNLPQVYLDLVLMPIYFLIIYAVIMVRNLMISKESEILYITSKSENEKKLIQQRISISRDLHDNIGAYANSLISKIDYLKMHNNDEKPTELNDLKENAESIMSLLRQTIWVLNNDNVTVEYFYDYFKQYAIKNFRGTSIKISFEEQIENNKVIDSQKVIQMFRILQEVIQNILKHSEATEVEIKLICLENIEIIVKDNGKGFDVDSKSNGYGIGNMRYRAEESNFDLKITSSEKSGTEIIVSEKYA